MKKYFVTYGDDKFADTIKRIILEAKKTNEFDVIRSYSSKDVSPEVKESPLFSIKRGGGLWSWKPDIILLILKEMDIGDFLIYCDAGCSLYRSTEWEKYWNILKEHDIIASRIYQSTFKWTRREIIDFFHSNEKNWIKSPMFMATVLFLKKSNFIIHFMEEWRSIMIENPKLVMDVNEDEKHYQLKKFRENRHDQAVFSALLYKYCKQYNGIYQLWEHVEDKDFFSSQAIRATRLRNLNCKDHVFRFGIKRMIKDFIYRPLFIIFQYFYH